MDAVLDRRSAGRWRSSSSPRRGGALSSATASPTQDIAELSELPTDRERRVRSKFVMKESTVQVNVVCCYCVSQTETTRIGVTVRARLEREPKRTAHNYRPQERR